MNIRDVLVLFPLLQSRHELAVYLWLVAELSLESIEIRVRVVANASERGATEVDL